MLGLKLAFAVPTPCTARRQNFKKPDAGIETLRGLTTHLLTLSQNFKKPDAGIETFVVKVPAPLALQCQNFKKPDAGIETGKLQNPCGS